MMRRLLFASLIVLVVPSAGSAEEIAREKPKRFPVTIQVDFGSAGQPSHQEQVLVDEGTTPKDAVSILFPIQSGEACCNTRELIAINGVRIDPAKNRWWNCRVNGSPQVSSFRTEVKPEDRIEWVYAERPQ